MKNFNIEVGEFYVNEREGIVREVVQQVDRDNVHVRSYYLRDGTPHQMLRMCFEVAIFYWADRKATPDEVARMKVSDAKLREEQEVAKVMVAALKNAPDEVLFEEVRRRGRQVI